MIDRKWFIYPLKKYPVGISYGKTETKKTGCFIPEIDQLNLNTGEK